MIASKGDSSKHGVKNTIATSGKRSKPVIANKEIYKQRMEAKKAQAAARRAARAAEKAKKEAEAQMAVEAKVPEKKVSAKKPAEKKVK